jgi:hypothetical protein
VTTPNERLADKLRDRQVKLFRHEAYLRREIGKFLTALEKAMAAAVISANIEGVSAASYKKARADKLIAGIADTIRDAYREINTFHRRDMAGVFEAEALYLIQQINQLIGSDIAVLASLPALATVRDTLIAGAPMQEWWGTQSADIRQRFANTIRAGVLAGDTDAMLVAKVRGTRELGFKDGLIEVSRRKAQILVRGAMSSVTAQARKAQMEANPKVFSGIQQVSVFDGRTSDTCIAYAGKVWSLPDYQPIGHSLPYNGGVPRHANCRSVEIAVINPDIGGEPSPDLTFESYLANKSKADVEQLLGKGKAELYLNGDISLTELVSQNGRPMTLEALRDAID